MLLYSSNILVYQSMYTSITDVVMFSQGRQSHGHIEIEYYGAFQEILRHLMVRRKQSHSTRIVLPDSKILK